MRNEIYDCRSCGACCKALPSYEGENYVRLYDIDIYRLSTDERSKFIIAIPPGPPYVSAEEYVSEGKSWSRRGAMKLTKDNACSALSGTIGKCVSCKIYDNRPDVCRRFEVGDHSCQFARSEAGLGEFGDDQ